VKKRFRTDPAVIRRATFSRTKEPETYYQSILQPFLPHWCNGQLKPDDFETYQNFYEDGALKCSNDPVQCQKAKLRGTKHHLKRQLSIDGAEELLRVA